VEQGGGDRPSHLVGVLREDAATTGTAVSLTLDVTRADERPVAGGVRVSVAGALAADAAPRWRAGRMIAIDLEFADLRRSAIWRLKTKIDDARAQGWDLFAEMILSVKREVQRASWRLATL